MKLRRGKKRRLVSSKQRPENLWNNLFRELRSNHMATSVVLHMSQMLPTKVHGPLREKVFAAPSQDEALAVLRQVRSFAVGCYGKRLHAYLTGVE